MKQITEVTEGNKMDEWNETGIIYHWILISGI